MPPPGYATDKAFWKLLTHFDQKLPLTLACVASAYGIGAGAVLAHKMLDGSERPVVPGR